MALLGVKSRPDHGCPEKSPLLALNLLEPFVQARRVGKPDRPATGTPDVRLSPPEPAGRTRLQPDYEESTAG